MKSLLPIVCLLFLLHSDAVSAENGKPIVKRYEFSIARGVSFRFCECPAGSFNKDGREITLPKSFYISETEVTQEQWEAVMGKNPSHFKGSKLPVEQVSWNDCQEFIDKLNGKIADMPIQTIPPAGYRVALPTEAQWEYACRAGSKTAYCFGDDEEKLGDYAWYSSNSDSKTHEVGTKKANDWGLYDMHGNVWEWCADLYEVDPISASAGKYRVCRGGAFYLDAGGDRGGCRSTDRGCDSPDHKRSYLGVRLVWQ